VGVEGTLGAPRGSATEVPRIDPEFVAEEKRVHRLWSFEQEYERQFMADARAVFDPSDMEAAVDPRIQTFGLLISRGGLDVGDSALAWSTGDRRRWRGDRHANTGRERYVTVAIAVVSADGIVMAADSRQ
jgi:hypothetical protein